MRTLFACIGFVTCLTGLAGCKPAATVFVKTPVGTIGGLNKIGVQEFLGIPYAKPPVGDLRWREPQPLPAFTEAFNATQPGSHCNQFALGTEKLPQSENCLFLNIWRPGGNQTPTSASKLPVMVFIHGSAFAMGSSNDVLWNGRMLASTRDVIVVSMNYRLGYLGFLSLPELTAEDGHSGNYTFYDQQLALKWVHQNIRAFGGDPDRITLFGQSAGAMSTCMQLASPGSAPLIHSAIMESGFCLEKVFTQQEAEHYGDIFSANAGCDSGDRLACLRGKSVAQINAALKASGIQNRLFAPSPALPVIPVIDGKFIDQPPRDLLENGSVAGKSVIIGVSPDEGTIFFLTHPPIASEKAYLDLLKSEYSERAGDVAALYPYNSYKTGLAAYAALSGDRFFSCNAKGTADAMVQGGALVHFYEFNQWVSPIVPRLLGMAGFETGPIHGAELPYLFMLDPGNPKLDSKDAYVANLIQSYWVNQAKNATPNSTGLPQWPQYDDTSHLYLEMDANPEIRADLKAKKCALLNSLPLIQL